ncbi:hypothetical protein [Chitinophaga rhizosphaerae]|uniref:hypothetical protein n=1 Tax=Chitinophaga rhizosphaerae TaxID=1864947 RepID=UPI000F80AF1B|nr:hypothetical protein [Chitinophaga rhizosphaerae]
MKKWPLIAIIGFALFLTSCAASMTPIEINRRLPTLTKSTYLTQSQAQEKVKKNTCIYLVKNREYVAPIGLTSKQDLKYGARGIDEWVKLDGGNAYVLKNYKWVTVDDNGSTQLHIDFDTMLCE